jgi:hypothetical protein
MVETTDMQQESQPLVSSSSSTSSLNGTSLKRAKHSAENSVELPYQQLAEIARERHDFFNIFALVFVIGATLINWDLTRLVQGYGPDEAWTGEHFYLNWATTVLYFLIDLLWVAVVPICVKSPGTIIKHHFVAIIYLSAPVFWVEYRWFMGACLTVEVNTWFLILRRLVYKRQSWIPAICVEVVDKSFYISWIVIRCFIYPSLLVKMVNLAIIGIQLSGHFWHWPLLFIPLHFFLCVLNLKWSYDLFEPIIRKRMKGNGAKQATVATGL